MNWSGVRVQAIFIFAKHREADGLIVQGMGAEPPHL